MVLNVVQSPKEVVYHSYSESPQLPPTPFHMPSIVPVLFQKGASRYSLKVSVGLHWIRREMHCIPPSLWYELWDAIEPHDRPNATSRLFAV